MKVWGEDPLLCPCCKGTMKVIGPMIRRDSRPKGDSLPEGQERSVAEWQR
jgi:hypothetical protein